MINGMTVQEAFDKAVDGILKQGRISYDEENQQCAYRAKNGDRCIIGQLMNNAQQEFVANGDNDPIDEIIEWSESELFKGWEDHSDLLSYMQQAHDQSHDAEEPMVEFKKECKRTAEKYNLEWNFS